MDPRTIYPVLPRLLCCLPHKYRERLCCGVGFPAQVRGTDPGTLRGGRGGDVDTQWGRCPPAPSSCCPPALSLQDTDHADAVVKSNGVGNGLPPPGPRRLEEEEEGQGYIRAAGTPAYTLQETSF